MAELTPNPFTRTDTEIEKKKSLGSRFLTGIRNAPAAALDLAKSVSTAAITPPEDGFFKFKPSRLTDVARGLVSGATFGVVPVREPETKAEAARTELGSLLGFAAPFTGVAKGASAGLKALGVGTKVAKRTAGVVAGGIAGGAEPLSRGDIGEAVEGAGTGAALVGLIEAALPVAGKTVKESVRFGKRLGERGSTKGELTKSTAPEDITVSLKKADVTAELAELDIKVERADKVTFAKTLDDAKVEIAKDPSAPARLSAQILEEPRPLNPVEKAMLLHERVRLSNLREKLDVDLSAAQRGGTKADIEGAQANMQSVRAEYQAVSEAALLQGTESGLSLAFQKMLLKRDFSLANLERQRRTITGKELTKIEKNETANMHGNIERTRQKLETKTKELKETQEASKKTITEIFKEPQPEKPFEPKRPAPRDPDSVEFRLKRREDGTPQGDILGKDDAVTLEPGEATIKINQRTGEVTTTRGIITEEIRGGIRDGEVDTLVQSKTLTPEGKDRLQKSVGEGVTPEQLAEIQRQAVERLRKKQAAEGEKTTTEPKVRKKLTDAQLEKRAVASLERSIKDLETRIKERDTASKRNPFTTQATPEVLELRARRDALRAELNEIRKLQKETKTPEQIRLQRLKTRLKNDTARLQERLELKDFAEKEKFPLELDKEASELLVAHEKAVEAFNEALYKDKLAQKPKSQKVISGVAETLNLSRAIVTSLDLSAVGRQGGFIGFGNPVRAAQAFPAMIEALRSEAGQAKVMAEIKSRKSFGLMKQSKLFFAERGKGLIGQEEVYMSRHVDKVPLVAASQRAYVTFLNKLRADSFDAMINGLAKESAVTLSEAKAVANYVNVATGRGATTRSTTALVNMNTVFFAPRLVLSRFQLLTAQPLRATSSPRVRRLIVQEYGKFLAGIGVMYALGQLAGGEVETDPRSSDFGKIKFGNTRVDVLTGISQASVFTARTGGTAVDLLSGGRTQVGGIKGLKSERISPLTGKDARKFGNKDLFDVLSTFFRTKFSPAVGTGVDILTGTDVVNNQVTAESSAANFLTPLVIQDIFEVMKEQGVPATVALSLLAILGFGMQTFDVTKRRREDRRGFFSAQRLQEKASKLFEGKAKAVVPPSTSKESALTPNPFTRK